MPGSGENFTQVYGVYPRKGNPVLIIPSSLYMIMAADESVTGEVITYGKGISLVSEKVKLDSAAEKKFQSAMKDPTTNFENAARCRAYPRAKEIFFGSQSRVVSFGHA